MNINRPVADTPGAIELKEDAASWAGYNKAHGKGGAGGGVGKQWQKPGGKVAMIGRAQEITREVTAKLDMKYGKGSISGGSKQAAYNKEKDSILSKRFKAEGITTDFSVVARMK